MASVSPPPSPVLAWEAVAELRGADRTPLSADACRADPAPAVQVHYPASVPPPPAPVGAGQERSPDDADADAVPGQDDLAVAVGRRALLDRRGGD